MKELGWRALAWGAVGQGSGHAGIVAGAYDAVAVRYADFVRGSLDSLPLERGVLAAFAELVLAADGGSVADLGCGPGHLTDHLRALGLDAFGVDLSPVMVELARREHPGVRFQVGSMDALDLADGSVGGILSWYSIIHAPAAEVAGYFAEFGRVLAAGGYLLVAFFDSGSGPLAGFDHKVTPALRWPADDLAALAREAGFTEIGRMLREPQPDERYRRGHLLLRREPG